MMDSVVKFISSFTTTQLAIVSLGIVLFLFLLRYAIKPNRYQWANVFLLFYLILYLFVAFALTPGNFNLCFSGKIGDCLINLSGSIRYLATWAVPLGLAVYVILLIASLFRKASGDIKYFN